MSRQDDAPTAGSTAGEPLPGRLSALLRQVARAPEAPEAASWERALHPGAVVGRFELVREIGRGGFGVVYQARDRELGRDVAFKAVRPGPRVDLRQDALLREAEATARLSHPNIVTLFDAGQGEHGPYLVLELLHGRTLAERLDAGPVPAAEAVRVGVEVAKGLAHAHAAGVIHRDLTPGNVYLCQDGQVKLLDLGLAHVFGRSRAGGGTPRYVAPEQWRGDPEDERTDVFSLGVMLHRMLSGELPAPEGGTPDHPVPPLDVAGAPALGPLVSRMLAHDPADRPRHAGEVLAALLAAQPALEPGGISAPAPARRRPARWRLLALAAALALALGLAWQPTGGGRPGPGRLPPSVAVLPFEDLSPQQDQAHFSEGLAEEILTALGKVEGLRVPGRISSFSFKGKEASLGEIGAALQVGAVLQGSVRRSGSRVRVTAQIVSVADGFKLWSDAFDRELTDIFAVQEEIAAAVVKAFDVPTAGRGPPVGRDHASASPEAYTQYLIGKQELRRIGEGSLARARAAFERALELDPAYAPAWAGLAYPVFMLSGDAGSPATIQAERRRALAAAERAVELAPELQEALSIRGILRSYIANDQAGARADLARAISLNGGDATSRARYAALLKREGRLSEATREARLAAELEPLSMYWTLLGTTLQEAGQLDEAEAAYRRQLQVSPQAIPPLVGLTRTLLLLGRAREALEVNARLPDPTLRLQGIAMAQHLLGDRQASQAALDELVVQSADGSAYDVAEVCAFRGEVDRAFEWLERALVQQEAGVFALLPTDPFLNGLRADPRFEALVRRAASTAAAGGP